MACHRLEALVHAHSMTIVPCRDTANKIAGMQEQMRQAFTSSMNSIATASSLISAVVSGSLSQLTELCPSTQSKIWLRRSLRVARLDLASGACVWMAQGAQRWAGRALARRPKHTLTPENLGTARPTMVCCQRGASCRSTDSGISGARTQWRGGGTN